MPRARFLPLIVDGAWNPELRAAFTDASGAYVIRHRKTRTVEYVGESHTGRGWTTLTRHFQDASGKFATRNQRRGGGSVTWTRAKPGDYEAQIHVTSKGVRKKSDADERATEKQAEFIKRYQPQGNIDDGTALADEFRAHRAQQEQEDAERPWYENPSKLVLDAPKGALVELGALTCLEQRRSLMAWGIRSAPVLAHDEDKRLFVVYAGKIARPSTLAEIRAYERFHWGQRAKGHARDGRIAKGPFVSLGPGVAVTYTTRKGSDRELVDYVHAWGKVPPIIVVHDCGNPRCAWDGAVALIGGTYTVEDRGIVG